MAQDLLAQLSKFGYSGMFLKKVTGLLFLFFFCMDLPNLENPEEAGPRKSFIVERQHF
jgi:hypothetical protein